MKAAVCREFGQPLRIEELTLDPPQAGEVRVELAACAICHSDITYLDGDWGGTPPQVFGHEAAGRVVETGAGVKSVEIGDHVLATLLRSCGHCHRCESGQPYVCCGEHALDSETRLRDADGTPVAQGLRTGAFAEEVVVDQSQVVVIPKELPFDVASLLSCGVITGMGAVVNTAQVSATSCVAVIGCGGVGLNSVQGAALSGCWPLIALDLVDAKLRSAREFGASHTVNPRREDAAEAVRGITGGRGVDYVFVAAGNSKAIEQGLSLLSTSGTLVLVGMPPSGDHVALEALDVADSNQRILGSKMGSSRLRVDIPRLVALYQNGRLKLDELITGRYPLEEINEAIGEVRADRALRNVIVF
jgi:Zn-dependent alcohol dehydrogenase